MCKNVKTGLLWKTSPWKRRNLYGLCLQSQLSLWRAISSIHPASELYSLTFFLNKQQRVETLALANQKWSVPDDVKPVMFFSCCKTLSALLFLSVRWHFFIAPPKLWVKDEIQSWTGWTSCADCSGASMFISHLVHWEEEPEGCSEWHLLLPEDPPGSSSCQRLSRDGITHPKPPSKEQTPSVTQKDPERNLWHRGRHRDLSNLSKPPSEVTWGSEDWRFSTRQTRLSFLFRNSERRHFCRRSHGTGKLGTAQARLLGASLAKQQFAGIWRARLGNSNQAEAKCVIYLRVQAEQCRVRNGSPETCEMILG